MFLLHSNAALQSDKCYPLSILHAKDIKQEATPSSCTFWRICTMVFRTRVVLIIHHCTIHTCSDCRKKNGETDVGGKI